MLNVILDNDQTLLRAGEIIARKKEIDLDDIVFVGAERGPNVITTLSSTYVLGDDSNEIYHLLQQGKKEGKTFEEIIAGKHFPRTDISTATLERYFEGSLPKSLQNAQREIEIGTLPFSYQNPKIHALNALFSLCFWSGSLSGGVNICPSNNIIDTLEKILFVLGFKKGEDYRVYGKGYYQIGTQALGRTFALLGIPFAQGRKANMDNFNLPWYTNFMYGFLFDSGEKFSKNSETNARIFQRTFIYAMLSEKISIVPGRDHLPIQCIGTKTEDTGRALTRIIADMLEMNFNFIQLDGQSLYTGRRSTSRRKGSLFGNRVYLDYDNTRNLLEFMSEINVPFRSSEQNPGTQIRQLAAHALGMLDGCPLNAKTSLTRGWVLVRHPDELTFDYHGEEGVWMTYEEIAKLNGIPKANITGGCANKKQLFPFRYRYDGRRKQNEIFICDINRDHLVGKRLIVPERNRETINLDDFITDDEGRLILKRYVKYGYSGLGWWVNCLDLGKENGVGRQQIHVRYKRSKAFFPMRYTTDGELKKFEIFVCPDNIDMLIGRGLKIPQDAGQEFLSIDDVVKKKDGRLVVPYKIHDYREIINSHMAQYVKWAPMALKKFNNKFGFYKFFTQTDPEKPFDKAFLGNNRGTFMRIYNFYRKNVDRSLFNTFDDWVMDKIDDPDVCEWVKAVPKTPEQAYGFRLSLDLEKYEDYTVNYTFMRLHERRWQSSFRLDAGTLLRNIDFSRSPKQFMSVKKLSELNSTYVSLFTVYAKEHKKHERTEMVFASYVASLLPFEEQRRKFLQIAGYMESSDPEVQRAAFEYFYPKYYQLCKRKGMAQDEIVKPDEFTKKVFPEYHKLRMQERK